MSDSQTLKALQALGAKCIRLEARCDALDAVLCVLAIRQGIPKDRIAAAIDTLTAQLHQKRLERIEDIDPATAADLDHRELGSDLLP